MVCHHSNALPFPSLIDAGICEYERKILIFVQEIQVPCIRATNEYQDCYLLSGDEIRVEDVSLDTPSHERMEDDRKYMRPSPTKANSHEADPGKESPLSLEAGDRLDVLVEQE